MLFSTSAKGKFILNKDTAQFGNSDAKVLLVTLDDETTGYKCVYRADIIELAMQAHVLDQGTFGPVIGEFVEHARTSQPFSQYVPEAVRLAFTPERLSNAQPRRDLLSHFFDAITSARKAAGKIISVAFVSMPSFHLFPFTSILASGVSGCRVWV